MKVKLTPKSGGVLVLETKDIRCVEDADCGDHSDTRVLVWMFARREPIELSRAEYQPLAEHLDFENEQRLKLLAAAKLQDDMGI